MAKHRRPPLEFTLADDRANILPGEKVGLDHRGRSRFRAVAARYVARANGFKAVVTPRGKVGLELVREFAPSAITLDLSLPDMDGWQILDRLKSDLATRHIPVFVISAQEEPENALKQGALRFLTKPIDESQIAEIFAKVNEMSETKAKKLLVIEDDESQRNSIRELIGNETAHLTDAANARRGPGCVAEGAVRLRGARSDAARHVRLRVDRKDPRRKRAPADHRLHREGSFAGRGRETESRRADHDREGRAQPGTALRSNRALAASGRRRRLPEEKREILRRLHDPDAILAGKKVLIVDDDIRNIFAMTSMLERYKMDVQSAETGKAALDLLQSEPETDLVLMDIMLPEMDGYETMRAIRKMYGFEQLPIIALTAKAMKGDREKCIDAGASDYIAKPVDTERLLTLLRNWLHR